MKKKAFILVLIILLIVASSFIILKYNNIIGFAILNLQANQNTNYIDGYIDESNLIEIDEISFRVGGGFLGTSYYRGFVDFNTSEIPDTATINSVKLNLTFNKYEGGGVGGAESAKINISALTLTAQTRVDAVQEATLNAECAGTGSTFLVSTTSYQGLSPNTQVQVDLGANAVTRLQENLSQDYFSVCLMFDDETINDWMYFNSSESEAKPTLIIDYTDSDTTPPNVTINSPKDSYTTDSYLVNITINETGYCEFSLNNGITNETLSTTDNLNFNATKSGISNGDYVIYAFCNDTAGNLNNTVNSSFTISVTTEETPSSPGGGGGGGCTVTSWNCTSWSSCINLNQTRACTSNCNTKKNETQACTNNLFEENKTTEIIPEQEKPKQEQKPLFDFSKLKSKKIIITAAITVTTITIVSVSIWAWLWALSIIPFFLLRLRHYSVSIFDTKNYLGFIDKNGKVNSNQVVEFIQRIKKNVKGQLTLAGRKENTVRFLFEKGFLEVQVNSPPILMAHFSDKASALEFKKALILAINILPKESRVVKEQIIEVIEKESIFSLFREYSRKAETERQLKKMQD